MATLNVAYPFPLATNHKRHHSACRFVSLRSVSPSPSLCSYFSSRIFFPSRRRPYECFASSSLPFETDSGGGSGGIVGDGGGEDGSGDGSSGGDPQLELGAKTAEDLLAPSSHTILLHVGGMTCGGCASSVKKILESQSQVSSAIVDLATSTAKVWPVSDATTVKNWQQQLGEALAEHLTTCGFASSFQGHEAMGRKIST